MWVLWGGRMLLKFSKNKKHIFIPDLFKQEIFIPEGMVKIDPVLQAISFVIGIHPRLGRGKENFEREFQKVDVVEEQDCYFILRISYEIFAFFVIHCLVTSGRDIALDQAVGHKNKKLVDKYRQGWKVPPIEALDKILRIYDLEVVFDHVFKVEKKDPLRKVA